MERVWSLGESLPVAQQRGVAAMARDEVVPRDHERQAGRTHVLLRAGVDHPILGPVDRLGAEVARHVADEGLSRGHLVVGELGELKALDRLIVAVVEELGLLVDVPVGRLGDGRVPIGLIVGHLVGGAVLLCLLNGTLGPGARSQVVRALLLAIREQIVADG